MVIALCSMLADNISWLVLLRYVAQNAVILSF